MAQDSCSLSTTTQRQEQPSVPHIEQQAVVQVPQPRSSRLHNDGSDSGAGAQSLLTLLTRYQTGRARLHLFVHAVCWLEHFDRAILGLGAD